MQQSLKLLTTALVAAFLAAVAVQGETPPNGFAIIPRPCELKPGDGQFELNAETVVFVDPAFSGENVDILLKALKRYLAKPTGFELQARQKDAAKKNSVVILKFSSSKKTDKPGYRLSVTKNGIEIEADNAEAAFDAIQSVRQLLPVEIYSPTKVANVKWTIPAVKINDYPRFQWRGLHIDSSRHFFPVEEIEKMLELMAIHKMNIFHWHICDDDAWRLEIKKYPKLTGETARGYRGGRYPKPKFYTQDDVRRIIRFAKERFITVVPEIEIPGHEKAAITAYPEWGAKNKKGRLGNVFNIRDNTVDALKNILDEVVELFPGKYIHCGGDEVWAAWVWEADPESKAKAAKLGLKNKHAIQNWFMNEIADYLKTKKRIMIGWGEILHPSLNKSVVVMVWRGNGGKVGPDAAKAGHNVIMAPGAYTYLDHPPATGERGMSRAVLTWQRVYSFDPTSKFSAELANKVLGCQGQLWSEFIPDGRRLEYMAFPRATALAEVAWTPESRKNLADFGNRLLWQIRRFDIMRINYRSPLTVKSKFRNGKILLETSIPNAVIRYSKDGNEPTDSSPIYKKPLQDEGTSINAKAFVDGKTGPTLLLPAASKPPFTGANAVKATKGIRRSDIISYWGNPAGTVSWRASFEKPGNYALSGVFSSPTQAVMKITVGDESQSFSVPASGSWKRQITVDIGTFHVKTPGVVKITLSVGKRKGYKGVNLWEINAKPVKK